MPINEEAVKAIARRIALDVHDERQTMSVNAVMSEVLPMFKRVNERVDTLEDNQHELRKGVEGLYPALAAQDARSDRRLDRIENKVDMLCSKDSNRDGANGVKRGLIKVVLGLVSAGEMVRIWNRLVTWWHIGGK